MFGTTADIFYADGTMDRGAQIWAYERRARRNDPEGTYLRSALRGARTSAGHVWDGRKRTWVAAPAVAP